MARRGCSHGNHVPPGWSPSHEISADDGEDHSHAKGLMTGVHPDVISENVSRLKKKREREFQAWQEEVLLVQRVHERKQRDKGVVPDGEVVEEVSGLVPPPLHDSFTPPRRISSSCLTSRCSAFRLFFASSCVRSAIDSVRFVSAAIPWLRPRSKAILAGKTEAANHG